MTVRNHLGSIVVYFDGDRENPWIINPPGPIVNRFKKVNDEPNNEDVSKNNFLVVPSAIIGVWGGNISSSFCFSPLQYKKTGDILLPPQMKTESEVKVTTSTTGEGEDEELEVTEKIPKYELPFFGSETGYALLSNIDIGGQGSANSGASNSSEDAETESTEDAANGEQDLDINESSNDNSQSSNRDPLFTCDAQIVSEIKFRMNVDSGTVNASKLQSDAISHYIILGKYIKASGGFGEKDEVTKKPEDEFASKIELEAQNVQVDEEKQGYKHTFSYNIKAKMTAGGHDMEGGWILDACKTPILTNFRMVAVPNREDAWEVDAIDATDLVMKYSESYSSSDFHSMNHSATIEFLLNKGMESSDDVVNKLYNLRNRAFYIEVYAGYLDCNYTKLNINEGYKLFTGLCLGGTINESAGRRTMSCQIVDYTKILQESYIFNSPFLDGMRDTNAIYTLLQMVGMKDTEVGDTGNAGPASLLKQLASTDLTEVRLQTQDGRGSFNTVYVLPNSYARLKEAFFKFQDGTPYWQVIQKITKKAGKVAFFDSYGVFHYENLPYDEYLYGGGEANDVEPLWQYTRSPDGAGQLIFDNIVRQRTVSDTFNIIHLMTSTPERELAIYDKVNWESIYDSSSPGFLGYKKVYLQQEGIFGSLNTLQALADHYSKFFKAPIVYKFQSYGVPARCFDIANVDGQNIIITNVSSEIDPQKNLWWQNVEGEWYGSEETYS